MLSDKVKGIRRARRESLLHNKIAELILRKSQDDPSLEGISVSRVRLSPDGKTCTIFLILRDGAASFVQVEPLLGRHLPYIKTSLARSLRIHRIPGLQFAPDKALEEQRHVSELIDNLKESGKL